MKKKSDEKKRSGVISQEQELRERAEALDREKRSEQLQDAVAMSPEEIQKMIHELRVHQIELEMQNDELRHIESELMETKARYFDLYDLAPIGYLTISESGIITEANLTACELFGVERGALVKKRFSQFIFRDDLDIYYRHRKALFATGDPQICDLRMLRSDMPFWAHLSATSRIVSNGLPSCFVVISDVSARKQAEKELRQSKERYKGLFEYSGVGIGYYSPEGIVISYNKKALENIGGQRDDYIGKSLAEIFPAKEATLYMSRLKAALSSYESQEYEDFLTLQSGRTWFSSTFSRVINETGEVVGVQIASTDVTKRKNAEAALGENEEKYRLLYTAMSQGLALHEIITDEDGKPVDYVFLDINESYTRLLGVTREMCIGKKITEVMPNVEQYWIDIFGKVALTGEPNYYENYLATTGGYYATYSYSPKKRQFAVLVTDITEKKNYEENLQYLSYHDQLTGLFNRRFYEEELNRLDVKRNLPISIIMADINGLKIINDSFGHTVGDEYLIALAEIIKSACRADEIIARLGGDEFGIILPKTDSAETAKIVNRLMDLTKKAEAGSIELSVSFGYDTKEIEEQLISDIIASAENHMYKHKIVERSSMRSKTVEMIMSALFEKSDREALHSERVSEICEEIATKMDFDHDDMEQIKIAGLVHDIGKIGIHEGILNKSGKLESDEWTAIKKHPEAGWRILNTTVEFSEIAQFVLHHHERFDGKGYPNGLKGEEIPIQARIIAVADAYDAMTNDRSYRTPISHEEAIVEIKRCSGTHFDPDIVDAFVG